MLLVLFNYSSITEAINSSIFNIFKIHIFFNLFSYSFRLNKLILFCVISLLYIAITFLINLNIKSRSSFFIDYSFFLILLMVLVILF